MLVPHGRGKQVTAYRLYWLFGAGKITTAEWLEAADDQAAQEEIRARRESRPCEVWEQRRLIGRVEPGTS